jgi:glycosyltransferase involved in cell wall biosynthesis
MTSVCILTSAHPPFDTRIFHKQARTLQTEGYDVTLVAHHDCDEIRNGIQINAIQPATSHLDRFLNLSKIYRTAQATKADVFHFHDPGLLPIGAALSLRTDAAVIYDCHEPYEISFQHYDFPPDIFNPLFGSFYPHVQSGFCRPFDAIVTATKWIQEDFEALGHDQVHLVRNFPMIENIKIDSGTVDRTHEFVLVYVGGLTQTRGLNVMIETLDHLRKMGMDAGLWLLGGFSDKKKETQAHSKVQAHTLANHVRFFGRVDHEQVFSYLAAADVGLALLDPEFYNFGIPTKVFEYMFSSIPVVASDTIANTEYLPEKCGSLVPYDQPKRIATTLLELAKNEERRSIMGEVGRELVEKQYSWEIEQTRLLNLYESVIE